MRKTWQAKGLGAADMLAYGGAAAAVAFIFALTFGALDGSALSSRTATGSSTLVAESSP